MMLNCLSVSTCTTEKLSTVGMQQEFTIKFEAKHVPVKGKLCSLQNLSSEDWARKKLQGKVVCQR